LCLTDTIDRQMGLYGLRDGRVATFAVHRTPDPVLPLDPSAAIRDEYGSLGWIIPQALDHCPPAAQVYYDQVAQIELPRWSHRRVVLLGDAAYAVSLLAGQGASLAIAGAYVLAEQLATAGSIETALNRYEQLWRPVAEDKQQAARDGIRWFLPHSPTQLRARHIMMGLSRLPGIDSYIARALTGKSTALIKELSATSHEPAHVGHCARSGKSSTAAAGPRGS
jgi:2-polyprenyl-6-methoxyphenol hydroxylase-like FAD-dependent oxidoreductase